MIEEQVKKVLIDNLCLDEEEVTNEAHICDDLGADSLDSVEIVMAIEDCFDIEISGEEAEKVKTVQDAINLVKKLKGSEV